MTDQREQVRPGVVDELVLVCLAHFDQEETMLAGSLEVLRELRHSLLQSDVARVSRCIERQQQATCAAGELASQRGLLRQRLCRELNIPLEQLTLRTLAERSAGALRARLLTSRQRLLAMAGEIELLQRGNAALIRQSLGLLQLLLGGLSGQGAQAPRYTSLGVLEPGSCGPIIQSRC